MNRSNEGPGDETRAVAELPQLNIEIVRRRARAADADELLISLRAAPSFEAFGDYLRGPAMWPWLMMAPALIWQQAMRQALTPWLPVPPRQLESDPPPAAPGRPGNVHPFPSRDS